MTPLHPGDGVGLVVAAAGSGTRFGPRRSKLLEPLAGTPLFLHCLRALAAVVPPERTVLVVPARVEDRFREALVGLAGGERVSVVPGGSSRCESVLCGLDALPPDLPFVAVQDAARPLTSAELLCRCIASARERGSGVAARRVTDTIKVADAACRVIETPNRSALWAAETPQVFRCAELREACEQALGLGLATTDDAAAVEVLGLPVYLVEAEAPNPKVTHETDLALIALLLEQHASGA
jgi:2-C-methyl-D-erythritol 4-phosphate cytidylyltransferase